MRVALYWLYPARQLSTGELPSLFWCYCDVRRGQIKVFSVLHHIFDKCVRFLLPTLVIYKICVGSRVSGPLQQKMLLFTYLIHILLTSYIKDWSNASLLTWTWDYVNVQCFQWLRPIISLYYIFTPIRQSESFSFSYRRWWEIKHQTWMWSIKFPLDNECI